MKWSIEQRTRTTFILVILLVIVIGFSSYRSTINFISANQTVSHTRQILDEIQATVTSILSIEVAQLDYITREDDVSLQAYHALDGQVEQHVSNLISLTAPTNRTIMATAPP